MNQSLRDYEDKLKWIVDNPNDTDADLAMIDAEILGESGHADVVRDVEKHQSELMGVYPAGLVGDIAKHCMEISPVPNRPFALMAGLLTISLLSRNRYIVPPFGTRLNLYVAAVGETGSGKDDPPQMVGRLASIAGADDCTTDGVASGVALQRSLSELPDHSLFYWQDEVWEMLQSADAFKGSVHKKELTSVLMTLYGRSKSAYKGRKYADSKQNIESISHPYVVFGGATTPARFMDALSQKYVADGFLNRLIVFQSKGVPEMLPPQANSLPAGMKQRLIDLYNPRYESARAMPESMASIEVDRESGVDRTLSEFNQDCRKMLSNPNLGALWTRGFENAVKVAGILAVGVDHDKPVVTMEQANWAIRLVRHCIQSFSLKLESQMSESVFDSYCKKALDLIKHADKYDGDKRWGHMVSIGMPRGLLTKSMRIKSQIVDDIVIYLKETQEIIEFEEDAITLYRVRGEFAD